MWTEVDTPVKPPISTYPYIFTMGCNIFIYGGASIKSNEVEQEMWIFDTVELR